MKVRPLTPRQREVLDLLATGLTGKEVANRLRLSPGTIVAHLNQIRRRRGSGTVLTLVRQFYDLVEKENPDGDERKS